MGRRLKHSLHDLSTITQTITKDALRLLLQFDRFIREDEQGALGEIEVDVFHGDAPLLNEGIMALVRRNVTT